MTNIGVVGGNEALQTKNILSGFYEQAGREESILILGTKETLREDEIGPFHMLIVNEKSEELSRYMAALSENGILITNADAKGISPYLKGMKARLVTYGFNQKASVTTSSITGEELQKVQCCIQRMFTTFSGETLEQQEFSVEIKNGHKNIYSILGALTAALLDDIYFP